MVLKQRKPRVLRGSYRGQIRCVNKQPTLVHGNCDWLPYISAIDIGHKALVSMFSDLYSSHGKRARHAGVPILSVLMR